MVVDFLTSATRSTYKQYRRFGDVGSCHVLVGRVLVIHYTTTPQPNTPTSYLLACRFRRWVGLLARTLRGFPYRSQIKSPAIRPPQVGNEGKAGPPGYVGKTATKPLCFALSNLPSSYNHSCNGTNFLHAHNKTSQNFYVFRPFDFQARCPSTAHLLRLGKAIEFFESCFYDIMTTQYDHPKYVKYVLAHIYVVYTLFIPYFGCVLLGIDSLRGGLAEGNRIFSQLAFLIL